MASGATKPSAISMAKTSMLGFRLLAMLRVLSRRPEQSLRAQHQYNGHDDKDDRIRRLGIENLGQTFDNAKPESGNNGSEDRTHASNHHDSKHDNDEVRAHYRVYGVDRRRQN